MGLGRELLEHLDKIQNATIHRERAQAALDLAGYGSDLQGRADHLEKARRYEDACLDAFDEWCKEHFRPDLPGGRAKKKAKADGE